MTLLGSAVPVRVSTFALVILSVLLVPLSGLMPVITGLDGALVSITRLVDAETKLMLPYKSVAVALRT